jgi:hypothetical protein
MGDDDKLLQAEEMMEEYRAEFASRLRKAEGEAKEALAAAAVETAEATAAKQALVVAQQKFAAAEAQGGHQHAEHEQRCVAQEAEHEQRCAAQEAEHEQRCAAQEAAHEQRCAAQEAAHMQRCAAQESELADLRQRLGQTEQIVREASRLAAIGQRDQNSAQQAHAAELARLQRALAESEQV